MSLFNDIVDFIEAYHTTMGEFPRRAAISQAAEISLGEPISPSELDVILHGEKLSKSLDERGIIPPWELHRNPIGLTPEQIAVAAALNNTADRRSNSRKLTHLGVSERKFGGWMHSKVFSDYMKISANNLLEHAEHAAHTALLAKVQSGDVNAVKFFFEMTGRYNPNYESTVNLQQLLSKFVEIVQKHIHNPDQLKAIAADLQMAYVESGAAATNSTRAIGSAHTKEIAPVEAVDSDSDFNKQRKALFF